MTDIKKKSNPQISGIRIKVEYAIGNCKAFLIINEEIRSFINDFRNLVMVLPCVLSNINNKLTYKNSLFNYLFIANLVFFIK